MKVITCKIPEDLDGRLEAEARRRRVSKSAVVRESLVQSLRRKGRKPRVSAYDLVKDLVGKLHGPSDLATNPKHMEGFGV